MTLTDLLIPTYRNMLGTLRGLLDKAEAQLGADAADALLSARLAPDMFPLATQSASLASRRRRRRCGCLGNRSTRSSRCSTKAATAGSLPARRPSPARGSTGP